MNLVLQVNIKVKPEKVDAFMRQVLANAGAARSEPGCRQFDVLVNPDDKTSVMLFEVYDDQKRRSRRTSRRRTSSSTSRKRCRCSRRASGTSGTRPRTREIRARPPLRGSRAG